MSAAQGQLDWLVNDFARDTPGVLHAWSRGGGIVTAGYGWCEGGRVVPAYAFTQGRGQALPLDALVTATEFAMENLPTLQLERRAIVRMSMRPTSVVEIGAALHLPAGVARVLVSDLASTGFLLVHLPPSTGAVGGPGQEIVERLLDGLRTR